MRCPKCRTKAHVLETRASDVDIRRRRECLNERCRFRWTTVEALFDTEYGPSIERPEDVIRGGLQPPRGMREPALRKARPGPDREAIAAALRVDARKRQMEYEARRARSADLSDDALDDAPGSLTAEDLKRELGRY